ncbi:MAG: hypothetical protein WC139_04915 [Candidatus Kapaibacterium sp.]
MSEKEVDDFLLHVVHELKKSPGYGEVSIGINNSKVVTIKPTPTYNFGGNKKN